MFAHFTRWKTELLLNQVPNGKFARTVLWGSEKKPQPSPREPLETGVLLWQKVEENFPQLMAAESWGSAEEAAWRVADTGSASFDKNFTSRRTA